MAKKESFNIGAMKLAQKISGYGKNAIADTITIGTSLESATITAIGAGKQLLGGDYIYVYPVKIGNVTVTTVTGDLVFDVNYYKSRKYFLTETISVTFAGDSLANVITAIETELTTAGIADKISVTDAGGQIRIQATDMKINFKIVSATGSTLTDLGLAVGDNGQPQIYKVSKNVGIAETSIGISELYLKNISEFSTVASLTDLEYTVFRHLGESTGATLTGTLTADTYKGSNKVAVQTEYGEGEAMLNITELVWNRDNLEYLKGWRKRDTGITFFSGKSADLRYKYGEYSCPIEFSFVGFTVNSCGDNDTELQHIECERCKAPGFTITMAKEFRTMSEDFMLLANQDRAYATIYKM